MKTAKFFFVFILFFFTSCAAQKDSLHGEEIMYSLIEHHYNLAKIEDPTQFLYYKTLPTKGNPQFNWTENMKLSEFLNDPVFKKDCNIIQTTFNSDQIKNLNKEFSNLKSSILDENQLSKAILNRRFLNQETYNKTPDAANKKISLPILIRGNGRIYAIFVEDAHNAGGNLYVYELWENQWKLVCKDSLWLV